MLRKHLVEHLMFSGIVGLIFAAVGAVASTMALLSEDLNKNPRTKWLITGMLLMLTLYAIIGSVVSFNSTDTPINTNNPAQSLTEDTNIASIRSTVTAEVSATITALEQVNSKEVYVTDLPSIMGIYTYNQEDPRVKPAQLSIISLDKGKESYNLEFSTQPDLESSSGIGITFKDTQDFSEYSYIEVAVTFGSPETDCKLWMKDIISNLSNSLVLGDQPPPGSKITISLVDDVRIVTIPMDYFRGVNVKVITNVSIGGMGTPGVHDVTIRYIKLIK